MSQFIFTCEHGGNSIPAHYQDLFKEYQEVLETHRGYDPGALKLARYLEKKLYVPLFYSNTSRLLIELNRSLHHPKLFSSITKILPDSKKKEIIDQYYLPYRNQVENKIADLIKQQQEVFHISVHSFTPVLNGVERKCEIGLLYDPKQRRERDFCKEWKLQIKKERPEYITRFNYPYRGIADGFTTYLRKKFPVNYSGIELEVNQKNLLENQEQVHQIISRSLSEVIKIYSLLKNKASGEAL